MFKHVMVEDVNHVQMVIMKKKITELEWYVDSQTGEKGMKDTVIEYIILVGKKLLVKDKEVIDLIVIDGIHSIGKKPLRS